MNKYFKTTNFYLASFLYARGSELVSIDRNDPKRCVFVFVDTPQRETLLEVFNFGQENDARVMVDARKLISGIKMLKDKLYQI